MTKQNKQPLEEAIAFLRQHPDVSARKVARDFGVPNSTLSRRVRQRPRAVVAVGRLTAPEETALCRYVDRLEAAHLALRKSFITEAANNILADRLRPDEYTPVGGRWTDRFLLRHRYSTAQQDAIRAQEDVLPVDYYSEELQKAAEKELAAMKKAAEKEVAAMKRAAEKAIKAAEKAAFEHAQAADVVQEAAADVQMQEAAADVQVQEAAEAGVQMQEAIVEAGVPQVQEDAAA